MLLHSSLRRPMSACMRRLAALHLTAQHRRDNYLQADILKLLETNLEGAAIVRFLHWAHLRKLLVTSLIALAVAD